ncbi:MAG: FHA domain-containing protein [Rhodocyclales bacterium]|nr:FHA domain-containing protein [Rhodocyclales bacterium]
MNIVFVAVALLALVLIAYYLFRPRIATQAVVADETSGPTSDTVAGSAANTGVDPMATLQCHNSALKAPAPRKGGADVRERQPRLIGVSKEVRGVTFPLEPTGAIIGRALDNRIQVLDPRVSQRHAWVGVVHDKAMVCDLNSTNGTFLNTASDTPITEAELKPNDTVLLGGHGGLQFRFVVD